MAQPISLEIPPRDPQGELSSRLQRAPQKHAEAVLAAYQVLQELHESGVFEVLRGTLGGGNKILEQFVEMAREPESIRATRNLLLLVKALGEIEPALLSDLTRAAPKALIKANLEESKPPGLFKLLSRFWNKDFRRGLAVFSNLMEGFGRNLIEKVPDNKK